MGTKNQADDLNQDDIDRIKMFLHYETNKSFIHENEILDNIDKILHIPLIIVHARFDLVCPLQSAWDLQKAHHASKIIIVPEFWAWRAEAARYSKKDIK